LSESDDDQEEHSTVTEKLKQRLQIVKNLGEDIKNKVCLIIRILFHFQRFLLDIFFER